MQILVSNNDSKIWAVSLKIVIPLYMSDSPLKNALSIYPL